MYDLIRLREEFPVLNECIYLDSASTSQTPRRAVEAMCEYFYHYSANHGRGAHHLARKTTEEFEKTRDTLAGFLRVDRDHLIFTKNTTDSINHVAHGLRWKRGDEVVVTSIDHHSNFLPWIALGERGVKIKIAYHRAGLIHAEDIRSLVTKRTKVVAITHMPNVTGVLQPVHEVAEIAHDAGASVVVDGAQSIGHVPFDVGEIDYLAIPGHKGLLGPQGTGALYVKDYTGLSISNHGGGIVKNVYLDRYELLPPPMQFEPGTPNIPGVIGLGKAIGLVQELGVKNIHRHEVALGTKLHKGISGIPGVILYSPEGTSVVSFNADGFTPDECARRLDGMKKICVRSGMHCAQPLASSFHSEGTVRASIGCYTTEEEVSIFCETLHSIAEEKN
jgi:cysteine desulfurase/selenocysteine lyase